MEFFPSCKYYIIMRRKHLFKGGRQTNWLKTQIWELMLLQDTFQKVIWELEPQQKPFQNSLISANLLSQGCCMYAHTGSGSLGLISKCCE